MAKIETTHEMLTQVYKTTREKLAVIHARLNRPLTLAEKSEAAVPSTVHCDHLIQAHLGKDKDMQTSDKTNKEVFDFLATASSKYNIPLLTSSNDFQIDSRAS